MVALILMNSYFPTLEKIGASVNGACVVLDILSELPWNGIHRAVKELFAPKMTRKWSLILEVNPQDRWREY